MIEWIVTSSVLIAAVLVLRRLFRGRISPMVQYALWGLVLVRLLVPFNFGSVAFSAANLGQQVAEHSAVSRVEETMVAQPTYEEAYERVSQRYQAQGIYISELQPAEQAEFEAQVALEQQGVSLAQVLTGIWLAGVVAVGAVFLLSNLRFRRRLRSHRVRLFDVNSPLQVYYAEDIDTPCLFGLFRPAIYLTPDAAADPTVLRHTLTHEEVHYRHWDHVWAVLRCVCLALHWYNPLVWWAANLSRRDGELACDQHTIRRLGEEERAQYGRTLIVMTCQKRPDLFVTATTMTTGKNGLRERILLIAKKPRMAVYTLCAVLVVAALCVGCTFTGGVTGDTPDVDAGEVQGITYGQPIFPQGEIVGVTVHFNWGDDVQVTAEQLEEVTTWLATFAYGREIGGDGITPGTAGVIATYSDGTTCASNLVWVTAGDTVYEVLRDAVPGCWQDILNGNKVTEEITVDFERDVLYQKEVPGQLNLVITPTEVGCYRYFVPYYEKELSQAMEQTVGTATEFVSGVMPAGSFAILWNNEWWWLNVDGSLTTTKRCIAPEDAAEVVALAEAAIDRVGQDDPVFPEDLVGVRSAVLSVGDSVYTVTDQGMLKQIEGVLTTSTRFAGGNCPYDGLLTLVMEDGSTKTIALATDGCTGWLSEGVCFDHGGEPLYALITDCVEAGTGRRIIYTQPLNENGSLPALTLDGVTIGDQERPSAWALYQSAPTDLGIWAKTGADALLGDYTVEVDDDGGMTYRAQDEQTPYGPLKRYITVDGDCLRYNATWADTEHTPYFDDPAVTDEEAIALALELAEAFGLAEKLEGVNPEVKWNADQSCYIYWNGNYDGLNLPERRLRVEVIGDDAVSLDLTGARFLVTEGTPGYFLSVEEALYCINYARSLAREDHSDFYTSTILRDVHLVWTNLFWYYAYTGDGYTTVGLFTPAYQFTFTSQSGKLTHTFLVDAYTGAVTTGTNEGDYPSPYVFAGN